jgi:hypothetical protein
MADIRVRLNKFTDKKMIRIESCSLLYFMVPRNKKVAAGHSYLLVSLGIFAFMKRLSKPLATSAVLRMFAFMVINDSKSGRRIYAHKQAHIPVVQIIIIL